MQAAPSSDDQVMEKRRSRTPISPPRRDVPLGSVARLHHLLAEARIVWLSTTRPDGRPHVVPVWFDWDGEIITVFSRPEAQKIRNIRNQPAVMLAIGRVDSMTEVELLEGHATIAERAPGLARLPSARFAAKYAAQLNEAGHSIDWFAAQFPRALRIRPTRLLDWGARSGRRIG
jgi:PPOX class probable F420-dependent enzyme